jgi:hypothetical protein
MKTPNAISDNVIDRDLELAEKTPSHVRIEEFSFDNYGAEETCEETLENRRLLREK